MHTRGSCLGFSYHQQSSSPPPSDYVPMSSISDKILEVTVVGCNKLKDSDWLSRQDPYVCLEYAGSKFRTRTCTDGGKNPTFQEKFVFTLIEGLRELNIAVWNSNIVTFDGFIGSGKVQLEKVLSKGYDDSSFSLQTKAGRDAGEVRLILHYAAAHLDKPPKTYAPFDPPDVAQQVSFRNSLTRVQNWWGANAGVSVSCTPIVVTVENGEEKRYTIVKMRCPHYAKLLSDTVCALTDMRYEICHANIFTEGLETSWEFCITNFNGSPISSESERQSVINCLEAVIKRKTLEICNWDKIFKACGEGIEAELLRRLSDDIVDASIKGRILENMKGLEFVISEKIKVALAGGFDIGGGIGSLYTGVDGGGVFNQEAKKQQIEALQKIIDDAIKSYLDTTGILPKNRVDTRIDMGSDNNADPTSGKAQLMKKIIGEATLEKVSEIVLAISAQAAFSLIAYASIDSSLTSKLATSPALLSVVGASAAAFTTSLTSLCLRDKKPKAASFLAKVGGIAVIASVIGAMAMYIPVNIQWVAILAAALPVLAVLYA